MVFHRLSLTLIVMNSILYGGEQHDSRFEFLPSEFPVVFEMIFDPENGTLSAECTPKEDIPVLMHLDVLQNVMDLARCKLHVRNGPKARYETTAPGFFVISIPGTVKKKKRQGIPLLKGISVKRKDYFWNFVTDEFWAELVEKSLSLPKHEQKNYEWRIALSPWIILSDDDGDREYVYARVVIDKEIVISGKDFEKLIQLKKQMESKGDSWFYHDRKANEIRLSDNSTQQLEEWEEVRIENVIQKKGPIQIDDLKVIGIDPLIKSDLVIPPENQQR